MGISLDYTMEVDRPIEEVFEYLTSPENDAEWKDEIVEAHPVDGEMGVGATWSQVADGPIGTPEITFECTDYDPPNRFGFEMASGFMGDRVRTTDAEYTLTPDGDGTQLEFTGTSEAQGLLRLLEPLLAGTVRKDIESAFDNLQTALESPDG